jgi:hypothetical protein
VQGLENLKFGEFGHGVAKRWVWLAILLPGATFASPTPTKAQEYESATQPAV